MNIDELQTQYWDDINKLLNRGEKIFKKAKDKIAEAEGPNSKTKYGPSDSCSKIMEEDDKAIKTSK